MTKELLVLDTLSASPSCKVIAAGIVETVINEVIVIVTAAVDALDVGAIAKAAIYGVVVVSFAF